MHPDVPHQHNRRTKLPDILTPMHDDQLCIRLDQFQLRVRTNRHELVAHLPDGFVDRDALIEHGPVADGWEDMPPRCLRLAASSAGDQTTDARHEHLQRRGPRDDLVARVALRQDGVPCARKSVLVSSSPPDESERVHAVPGRPHRLDQAIRQDASDRFSVQEFLWKCNRCLQNNYTLALITKQKNRRNGLTTSIVGPTRSTSTFA